eukprot:TRINITY_DN26783_c0_g1_i1.p1 TRINITY_DN26783_c0_g1~~TRINITY_DN26783_c0_g1_i1.p1  ORF type:complete len:157 (-),score=23.29 TRINITY_DN26783_c0_g1_i1:252-722(-)
MLHLPHVDDAAARRTGAPLKSVFHRCNKEGVDVEVDRQIPKHTKQLAFIDSESSTPYTIISPRSKKTMAALPPLAEPRTSEMYTGQAVASLSSTGLFMDSRTFRSSTWIHTPRKGRVEVKPTGPSLQEERAFRMEQRKVLQKMRALEPPEASKLHR